MKYIGRLFGYLKRPVLRAKLQDIDELFAQAVLNGTRRNLPLSAKVNKYGTTRRQ